MGKMSGKYMKPPFVWEGQKKGLQQSTQFKPWTKVQIRAMKAGTYDWSTHAEQRA